jgi:antitoxin component YwqK of YwqJK toxin-antitoxin module
VFSDGKQYYNTGALQYEGTYSANGNPDGIGVSYDENGKIKFHGIFKEGKPVQQ